MKVKMTENNNNSPAFNIQRAAGMYAIIVLILNVSSTFILYSHYGPLTPNGNRYYHPFDVSSVSWIMMLLCVAAFFALLLPTYKFARSKEVVYKYGLFPALSNSAKAISSILTVINLCSGLLFTIAFVLITIEYITNHSRVMAEDLETLFLGFAFVCCIVFWMVIDVIYLIIYRKKW